MRTIFVCISFFTVIISSFGFSDKRKENLFCDGSASAKNWVDSIFESLSSQERLMQLFMIHAYSNKNDNYNQKLIDKINKYKPGGVVFFQGTPQNEAILTNKMQSISKVPLLISIDGECGLGSRLKGTTTFPKQMTLGAIENNNLIYEMGREIARQFKRMGIHINFAPVADVNNNRNNPVINNRSFGEDKLNVTRKSIAYMKGLQDGGIIAVGKHFPGHGDTESDSHTSLPVIRHSKEQLEDIELPAFQALINEGIMGIMTAHLSIPSLDSSNIAVSMSKNVVSDLLQKDMGFKGLCFTDALNMQGARVGMRAGETDAKALIAGNDILLFTADIDNAITEIKKAIKSGRVSQKDIDIKCKKILKAKYFCGLNKKTTINTSKLWSDLNTTNSFALQRKIYEEAITMIKNDNNLIPLKRLDTLKIASINIGGTKANRFQNTLLRYTDVKNFHIDASASIEEYNTLIDKLSNYNLIIICKSKNLNSKKKHYGNTLNSINFIEELSKKKKVIFCYPGNPYAISEYKSKKINSILISYEENRITEELLAQAIFGGIACNGKLPVSISDTYRCGLGIKSNKTRLGYNIPENVGMNSTFLIKNIDSLISKAIDKKATPGCQVLIAKDGYIIFDKCYGYHTYKKQHKVNINSIYDVASITKISATLPSLMHLYEKDKIKLEHELSEYLPTSKNTNKGNLKIKDILAHQAGLVPFIPLFQELIDKEKLEGNLFSNQKNSNNHLKVAPRLYINPDFEYKQGAFNSLKEGDYITKVSPSLYISNRYKDTIMDIIYKSDVMEKPKYKYSDLGFILLKESMENLIGKSLNSYITENFYKKLGAERTLFYPQKKFNEKNIVPSTDDNIYRKNVIKGYVHDPTSALLGGYAGNSGLFSNALGLAKIMSVYLNKGSYGGEQFFKSSTIDTFTAKVNESDGNRRGLGFDKPEPTKRKNGPTSTYASLKSFGHTGFTGTYAWCDPDNNTIYIFLSNRTYPQEHNPKLLKLNTRTNVQEVIYKAIELFEKHNNEHKNNNE